VAGGKYTTYRAMSEETVEKALKTFSIEERVPYLRSNTFEALNPKATTQSPFVCESQKRRWAQHYEIPLKVVEKLISRHAEEVEDILEKFSRKALSKWGSSPQNETELYYDLECRHAIETAMCFNLVDFYLRRVPIFLSLPDHGMSQLDHLAKIFQERFNWSDSELKSQKKRLENHMEKELSWRRIISPA
jgi:glycerol-3-phosphate dehydrogenase